MLPVLLFTLFVSGTQRLTLLWISGFGVSSDQLHGVLLWSVFVLVFGIKLPLMPCHLWLPEAHVAAPTAGSVLLSGIFLKLGGFGLVFMTLPLGALHSSFSEPVVVALSISSLTLGSLSTLRQVDLKKIVAYSSIVHMGLVPLVLFSQSELCVTGAMWVMLSHGLVSPALFVLVGQLLIVMPLNF